MARFLIKDMTTRTIPVVDFGCRHGKLSYLAEDVFDATYYDEDDFNPDEYEYYDEIISLIRENYDGTEAFYDQVLDCADEYINDAFNEYEIPASVRPGSCKWNIPRSGWYDTAIEFDLDIDLDWVEDTFMELSKDQHFIDFVRENFKSYDGFISYIPNTIRELKWLLDPTDDNYWKVVAVLIRYFIYCDESIADNISEGMLEDIQGNANFTTRSELEIYR